jgi:hypothetical protein
MTRSESAISRAAGWCPLRVPLTDTCTGVTFGGLWAPAHLTWSHPASVAWLPAGRDVTSVSQFLDRGGGLGFGEQSALRPEKSCRQPAIPQPCPRRLSNGSAALISDGAPVIRFLDSLFGEL